MVLLLYTEAFSLTGQPGVVKRTSDQLARSLALHDYSHLEDSADVAGSTLTTLIRELIGQSYIANFLP